MMSFDVPTKVLPAQDIANFFQQIEARRDELQIQEYSLSQTTLDHVFINFNALQADNE